MEEKIENLSSEEVSKLKQEKKVNISTHKVTKSVFKILTSNIFTLFNAINVLIAIALALVKAWTDLFFIFVVLLNLVIGIAQELHAKKLVDKLSLMNISKVKVIRDDKEVEIKVDELVLNDTYILESGMQVPCDSVILKGNVELNESILTGESDTIYHGSEDEILSGSIVVSGKAYCKVMRVGDDNYTQKIANESKKLKKLNSQLLQSMKKVTFISTLLIIPLGIALFLEGYFLRHTQIAELVPMTAGSLLGMLPKGLVLLTSVALATGVIKLSKMKILVQDIYSLETLSHVDVVCLDKTGTITTGEMKVEQKIKLNKNINYNEVDKIIGAYLGYIDDNNQTFKALKQTFPIIDEVKFLSKINFSSQRKYSACQLEDNTYYMIGAYDKLCKTKIPYLENMLTQGKRILVIGQTSSLDNIQDNFIPYYGIVIEDVIRHSAYETIEYFNKEGVNCKIVSGDNPLTVLSIAQKVGFKDPKVIDMSKFDTENDLYELIDNYDIFARVTPSQKKLIVDALHKKGKKVAMTGDGVNDLLALKEADCSIALASGSDASKQISQVVLMDSDFKNLPYVLLEGRRVVNNVKRSAQVFFIKTIYSTLMSFVCLFLNVPFPFLPFMITVVDLVCEAFPSFFTIFDKQYQKVNNYFFPSVLKTAIPNALVITVYVSFMMLFYKKMEISFEQMRTISYYILVSVTMFSVLMSMFPYTKWRVFIVCFMISGFTIGAIVFKDLVHLVVIKDVIVLALLMIGSAVLFSLCLNKLFDKIFNSKKFKLKHNISLETEV